MLGVYLQLQDVFMCEIKCENHHDIRIDEKIYQYFLCLN
jgi:hypothetical protein